MLTTVGLVILGFILYIAGAISLLLYMISRMVGSDGWDDSNMTNALRLIVHIVLHPEDCVKMFYLTNEQLELLKSYDHDPKKPFWYLPFDEITEVVKTRPDFDVAEYKEEE